MLNAVNINFIAANKYIAPDTAVGQLFSVFVIVVAAAEIVVGLALVYPYGSAEQWTRTTLIC